MSPPNEPPRLIIPGRPTAPAGNTLYVTGPGNTVRPHTIPPVRTDPGFYQKLIQGLNPLRQTTRSAMVLSGLGTATLALDVMATLNLGNPFLFYDRKETWKETAGLLEGARSDVWRSYFDDISPNWEGRAVETLQQYIRFNVNGLYGQLGKVSNQSSTTMNGLFWEVLEYDLSVFGLYAASAPVLLAVSKLSAHPMGRAALITSVTTFAGVAGNLVKQFADVCKTYEGELNKQELMLNDLRGAFYNSGNPARGERDLQLTPAIQDPAQLREFWKSA